MKQRFAIYVVLLHVVAFIGFSPIINAAPGDLDPTFSGDGKLIQGIPGVSSDEANATLMQSDGKILVAGTSSFGGINSFSIVRYNPNGSLDAAFGDGGKKLFPINSSSGCKAIAIQPGGKIVMVGYSSKGTERYDFAVARVNPDGSLDTTFNGDGTLTTDIVLSDIATGVKIQTDGKIVVAGYSGGIDPDFSLARYNSDGSLDISFDGDGKVLTPIGTVGDFAYDVAIQTDGKIVTAGYVDSFTGISMGLVRYNPDGSLDTSLNGTGKLQVTVINSSRAYSVLIQPDGKYVLAGYTSDSTTSYFAVVRLKPDGTFDNSFDGDGKATTSATFNIDGNISAAMQPDGKIILANHIRNGNDTDFALLRYNADGSPDTSFDGDGKVITDILNSVNSAHSVAVQNDGKIIAVGETDSDGSSTFNLDFLTIRYNTDGSIDNSFEGDGISMLNNGFGISSANAAVIQPDGKIIVAGSSITNSYYRKFTLMRYHPNGTLDTSFGVDGIAITDIAGYISEVNAVALQPDGKIVAGGFVRAFSPLRHDFALTRYNADGSIDTTFDGDGIVTTSISAFDDTINAIVIQPDGKIFAGGTNTIDSEGNITDFSFARYNADGSLDSTFRGGGKFTYNLGLSENLSELLFQPDGKIVAVGSYKNNNSGNSLFTLIRFTTTGENDGSFGNGGVTTVNFGGAKIYADAAALQLDGKIVVAGYNYTTSYSLALARLNSNGTLDTSFDSDGTLLTNFNLSSVKASTVVIQPDGKILVGGNILLGEANSWDALLIRYNSNGSVDTSYGTNGQRKFDWFNGTSDGVGELILDSNGRAIIVGGASNNIALARFLGDSAIPNKAPFDFDGDGKTDISIFRPSGGEWWIDRSSANGTLAVAFGSLTDKLVPGDFTGDGKSDIAFWRPSTGFWYILRSEDFSFYGFNFGAAGDIPVAADFDGDGKADQAVFRPSNNGWYIQKSSGGIDSLTFGANGDSLVVADYDGDGKSDIAITRINNGNREWWIRRSSNNQVFSVIFGEANDKSVQGDYTGDGKADIAFFRPSNGTWYILRSEEANSFYGFPFGTSGDTPTPGDYDGDGKFDAAIFRSSNSGWYQLRSTQGFTAVTFGLSNDIPVSSAFVP